MAERCNEEVYKRDPDFRSYDLAYYQQLLPFITGDVLDVGCGACMFIKEYIKKPEVTSVFGVDKYTHELFIDDKASYETLILPCEIPTDKKFDTIVSTEFLEHIERSELEPMLEEIKSKLKPDGLFIGSTPNKISKTTNPFHLYEYTLSELVSIMKNYFSEVEAWDNGRNCTLWTAKI